MNLLKVLDELESKWGANTQKGYIISIVIVMLTQTTLFLIGLLVARHSGEVLFGKYSVASNALFAIATVLNLGVDAIITFYVPKLYSNNRHGEIIQLLESIRAFLRPKYIAVFVVGVFLALAMVALHLATKQINFAYAHPLFLFLWGTVTISLFNIYLKIFRSVNYALTASVLVALQVLCYFVLAMMVIYCVHPILSPTNLQYIPHLMLVAFVTSFIMIQVICFFYRKKQLGFFRTRPFEKLSYDWKEKMSGYTVQNLNKYIFAFIPLTFLEFIGQDGRSVGLFAAVTSISDLAINLFLYPLVVSMGAQISKLLVHEKRYLLKVMLQNVLMCFCVCFVVVIVIDNCAYSILHLFRSGFTRALPFLHYSLLVVLIASISTPISKLVQFSDNGSEVGARITVFLLSTQCIACSILVPWFQLKGAIICYITSYFLFALLMIFFAWRIVSKSR